MANMTTGMVERRLLDIRLIVEGVANDLPGGVTAKKGMQYIVGDTPAGAFASGAANDIAIYSGSAWRFIKPDVLQLEIFDIEDEAFKAWDGTAWATRKTIGGPGHKIENHTLTAAEATAKAFDLADVVKTGEEGNVVAIVQGVGQYAGEAFTVATASNKSTFTWITNDITLMEGDKFTVIYAV